MGQTFFSVASSFEQTIQKIKDFPQSEDALTTK
jgi:hypothetical protein